jgi:hypothetical protein
MASRPSKFAKTREESLAVLQINPTTSPQFPPSPTPSPNPESPTNPNQNNLKRGESGPALAADIEHHKDSSMALTEVRGMKARIFDDGEVSRQLSSEQHLMPWRKDLTTLVDK